MENIVTRNRATIYSNGIADFQRAYSVSSKKPTSIILPVNQEHLGDILASLSVLGQVKIESPPTYQPANAHDTSLTISPDDGYESMVRQLSGCDIVVTTIAKKKIKGALVGLDTQFRPSEGEPVEETFLVIHQSGALERIPFTEVTNIKFDDEFVQAEIKKALDFQLRRIKPNSSFVEFTLSTEEPQTEAIVQYTVPAAAWKITYRLIMLEDQSIEFHGHAVVDNNTEEDWVDFQIAVVMGQPITFSTDLADSKTPARNHVNIVQETALGVVEPEPVMMASVAPGEPSESMDYLDMEARSPRQMMKYSKRSRSAPSAKFDESEVSDSGDFCMFECSVPVSINSQRSAVIPLFQTMLSQSTAVLHYKYSNHNERPFRAVRFKNTTDHSLSRGVCTVFDGSNYAGSCIVPGCRPEEETLLPHALETGVRINSIRKQLKRRRTSVRVSEGIAYQQFHLLRQTDYQITSSRDEDFPLVLDHDELLAQSNRQVQIIPVEDGEQKSPEDFDFHNLKRGLRIECPLAAKQNLIIRVIETKIEKSNVVLAGDYLDDEIDVHWLISNFIESNAEIASEDEIRNCMELQRQIDELKEQAAHAQNEVERLSKRQERLRKNIKAGGGKARIEKWENDLAKAEDAIVQIEEQRIPELRERRLEIREQLYLAIKKLAIEWID